MTDPEMFSGSILNVGANAAKGVGIKLETDDGRIYRQIVITAYRVTSVSGSDAVTSGVSLCTDFDFEIYDRDKGGWTSPSVLGLLSKDADIDTQSNAVNLELRYEDVNGEPYVWVRIVNNSVLTCDFLIDIWARPASLPVNAPKTDLPEVPFFRGL